MTNQKKEEMLKWNIGDILFNKKTQVVVKLESCWSKDKKVEELKDDQYLWVDKSYGGDGYGVSIKVSELEDWVKVNTLNDFLGFPNAHANFAIMEIWNLTKQLKGTTII